MSQARSQRDGTTRSGKGRGKVLSEGGRPQVSTEERHELARCCAFFKALHYRVAAPDQVRLADVQAIEQDLDAAVRGRGARRR